MGRRLWIKRHLDAGWTMSPSGGHMVKGEGRKKVENRIGCDHPLPLPGDERFNPLEHAPAFRLHPGAVFARPNRYRIPSGQLVDAWGAFTEPDACSECGSSHGENRFRVLVKQQLRPNASVQERAKQVFTFCRRCTSSEERALLIQPVTKKGER